MAKGDDAVARKKNKAMRKKLNRKSDSATVSARVAAIIAAKKRRKSGKRRMCQGMCFSLPTPDDPFNERHGKMDFSTKKGTNEKVKGKIPVSEKASSAGRRNEKVNGLKVKYEEMVATEEIEGKVCNSLERTELQANREGGESCLQKAARENSDCPSKFLILCLNEIETAMGNNSTCSNQDEKPLFMNTWGVEFWRGYLSGKDVLETSGSSSTAEQIAWIVSTAADAMARKEKEGLIVSSPFLVFLVPSQGKATKVRSVCKPLKALGIHTVSLHPGASLVHQINGLKSCEPEFLVSTPERLMEIVSMKGIDISGVSLLVIDDLDSLCSGGYLDAIRSIRQAISGKHQTVVFNNSFTFGSTSVIQRLLAGSVSRVSVNDSVASQSACIIQSVNVCASSEEKLLKCVEGLDHAYGGQSKSSKVLYIVRKEGEFQKLGATLKLKGYSISRSANCTMSEVNKGGKSVAYMTDIEQTSGINLEEYEVVVLPDFVPSTEDYVQILTTMARYSINGVLQSFLTKENAANAEPLVKILEECGQTVPEGLTKLCVLSSSTMMES